MKCGNRSSKTRGWIGVGRLGEQQTFFQACRVRMAAGLSQNVRTQSAEGCRPARRIRWDEQAAQADAGRVERDDFAIGGEAAEADQHADQHGHGNGEGQDGRQRAEKNQRNGADAAGMADDQIHQANKLRNEENESEDGESQQGVRGHFAADIFIEKAHECAAGF